MTHSKKIRIFEKYVADGLGEQVIVNIIDVWDFDPDKLFRSDVIRDTMTVNDTLCQIRDKNGYLYDMDVKELIKLIGRKKTVSIKKEYEDTKKTFFELYPDYYEKMEKRFNQFMGVYNKYKNQFIS